MEKRDIKEVINKIIQGDCIEELKKIPDKSIDFIFADPPYFMQTSGELKRPEGSTFAGVDDDWDKFSGFNQYDEFCFNWLKECRRILKNNGSICVIGSFQNIYRIGFVMQNLKFWILNDIIWSKPNAPPNFAGSRFQNSHETMLWCSRGEKTKYTFNYKTMKHLNGGKQDKSVWNIGICIGSERIKGSDGKKAHSTQKPEKLLYKIILASTKPGDIVLDPFFGTGTTGAIAKILGRNYIGIEREQDYILVAEERIKNVTPEINEITELKLEVKPPKVPMEELIKVKMLSVGQKLYDKSNTVSAEILENGHVNDGEETLSIHFMSAKFLNKPNHNGWDYWYFMDGDNLESINILRGRYSKKYLKKED